MGNANRSHRSWLVVGVINGVVAFGGLFYWNSSAADDTPASSSAQAQSQPNSADNSVAEKPTSQPTATSYSVSTTDNDERIQQALATTVKFAFNDTPLREAFAEIGKQHGIVVWIDERALTDLNITSDTPVTRKLNDISLKSALRLLLRPLQLTFRADAGVLKITSQTEYDNQLEIRVYPVGDLLTPFDRPEAHDEADFDSLIDVISSTIGPTSWDNVGGPGSMSPHGQTLVISQTAEIHDEIEGLVRTLRKVRSAQQKQLGGAGSDIQNDERSDAIRRALNKPLAAAWDFSDIPLRDALDFIGKSSGIQVQIDDRALTDLNITSDTPVTTQLRGILLKDALDLLLQSLQLTYLINNEVLSITSQTEADNLLQVRVYPVGDLLECGSDQGFNAAHCDFDSLADLIQTTVAPTSWDDVGGPSSIGFYEGALALVLSQTQDVHVQIDALLARMRQAQPPRRENTAAARAPVDKSALITRVYALWQFGPQRERLMQGVQPNAAATPESPRRRARAQAASFAQLGGGGLGGGMPASGFGGGALGETDFITIPPPGVPAEQAASLVRRFVEPDSWKQPGVVLQAAPNRLVIRQTAPVHKKTEEFLERLGPWRDAQRFAFPCGLAGSAAFGPTATFPGSAFQIADPFGSPRDGNANHDPFAPPANANATTDPFGAPAEERPRAPAAVAAVAKPTKSRLPAAPYLPSAAEARIREELSNETEMEFNDLPLRDAVGYLKDKHGIEIQIDEKDLAECGVKKGAPITLTVKGISLRSALRLLLSQLSKSATFVVADEVLLITSREGAMQRKSVRIYDVSDFVEPRSTAGGDPFGAPAPAPPPYAAGTLTGVQGLLNVIERAIAPGTWGAEQGTGVVPLVRNDSALLVVHHSASVHDEIVDLLSSLREMRKQGRRAEK